MNQISKHQLFSLMIVFEIGSTTLFALGIKAKQDAWIVVLVAMFISLAFSLVHIKLYKEFPKKNYVEIIISILGKYLGIPLSLLYSVLWLWAATRNLREFGELILLTYLPNTPLNVILFTFTITIIYVLSLGVSVLGRTGEIIMPLIVFFIIGIFILIFISGEVQLKNLAPILGNGIKPVLKASFPSTSIFPFNVIFIFSMYWNFAEDEDTVPRVMITAIILTGLLISFSSLIYISVLGVEYTAISTIPFIIIVKMVSIGEFFSNLDAIGISVMFLGGFYKVCILVNGITLILATVFKIKKYNFLLIAVGLLTLWISIIFEPNYTYHKWMNPFDLNYYYTAFFYVIPILLLLIHLLKKKTRL